MYIYIYIYTWRLFCHRWQNNILYIFYTSYDTCLYCFVWQNRTARLQIWTANLYLCSYLFEFVNCFSELCKWYTVGKLWKIRNFFMLKLFPNFQWFKFNFENRKHSKTRLKRNFHLFSKPQIRITYMIRHWKAIEIAQLCYLRKFFQIHHGFWTILKILEFRSIQKRADCNLSRFSQRFVRMMQIIWHWIDMEQTQLFHVLSFFKFCTVFE
jgi:hypothetical protein